MSNIKITKRQVVILFFVGFFTMLCFAYSFMPLCFQKPIDSVPTITMTLEPLIDVIAACQEIAFTVEQGDTLDLNSMNYAVSRDQIKQYNRMGTAEISPRMMLLIPLCNNMPTPTVTPAR
jgi:hypothetical protein